MVKVFLENKKPLFENSSYKIFTGGESLQLYKQGILIYEDTEEKALFSYDINNAAINELREFKGSVDWEVYSALCSANKVVAKYYLENITDKVYEGSKLDYTWHSSQWSEEYREVIGNAKIIHQKAIDACHAKGITVDISDYIVVPENVYKSLTKQFEGIGALMVAGKSGEFYENYCEKTERRVKEALTILEYCEYPMHPELEFRYGFFEKGTTQARINIKERIIMISQGMLQKPLHDIIAMLIEENEHFNTGFGDETREFQQHFIDLYTRELLSKNLIEI